MCGRKGAARRSPARKRRAGFGASATGKPAPPRRPRGILPYPHGRRCLPGALRRRLVRRKPAIECCEVAITDFHRPPPSQTAEAVPVPRRRGRDAGTRRLSRPGGDLPSRRPGGPEGRRRVRGKRDERRRTLLTGEAGRRWRAGGTLATPNRRCSTAMRYMRRGSPLTPFLTITFKGWLQTYSQPNLFTSSRTRRPHIENAHPARRSPPSMAHAGLATLRRPMAAAASLVQVHWFTGGTTGG